MKEVMRGGSLMSPAEVRRASGHTTIIQRNERDKRGLPSGASIGRIPPQAPVAAFT